MKNKKLLIFLSILIILLVGFAGGYLVNEKLISKDQNQKCKEPEEKDEVSKGEDKQEYDTDNVESFFINIPDGYTVFSLDVDLESTYGNSIYPNNIIDIYIKFIDDSGELVYGKLMENIKVQAVKDRNGQNVLENIDEPSIPSQLIFGLPDEMFLLLTKAKYIGYSLEILPVPNGSTATNVDTILSSEVLRNFILSKTVVLPEE